MSARGKAAIVRLAKAIIRGNDASVPVRKRTKGPLLERGAACERMHNLICTIRMAGDGREYTACRELNSAVSDLRKQASDVRLSASIRAKAVTALAVAEGFLPESELEDSPASTYLKSLLAPAPPQKPAIVPIYDFRAALREIDERLAREAAQAGGSDEL